jgi:radical SAM superfamily enzyme YgiQ (UPF0313 family)
MDVLLINPPWSGSPGYPTLGLAYIASVLEKNNFSVGILDMVVEPKSDGELEKFLLGAKPTVIGVTAMTPQANDAFKLTSFIKKIWKDSLIVLGGPHATATPESCLGNSIDMVCIGEGEYTMLDIARYAREGGSLRDIKGIAFKQDGKAVFAEQRELIKDLDELPFPARHLLPITKYTFMQKRADTDFKKSTTMITSRGCPYGCIYCNKKIFGYKFRARSAKNVVDEMEHLVEKYKVEAIFFEDDTFTLNKKRVAAICDEILDRKLEIEWTSQARVNTITRDLIFKMKKAGARWIEFGVESGSQRVLEILKKKITVQQVRDAFAWSKEAGIKRYAFFMLGIPGETREDIGQTIKLIEEIEPDELQLSILTPYPGTEVWDEFVRKNPIDINKMDWSSLVITDGIASMSEHISLEELKKIREEVIAKFERKKYLNRPHLIAKALLRIRSKEELRSALKKGKQMLGGIREKS